MTIRLKLTMAFIAVILVTNAVLSLITVNYIGRVWLKEVQTRVRLDLNSARSAYENHLERLQLSLSAMLLDPRLPDAIVTENREQLSGLLTEPYEFGRMDLLVVLDADGRVIVRAHHPAGGDGDYAANPVVAAALQQRQLTSGTIILPASHLRAEGEKLAARARLRLLPTPAAKPTSDEIRADGMAIAAALPVLADDGELLGVLYAADLLNQRYGIVDGIRDEVFAHESYEDREIGTVTIFQGDLRIATNVTRDDGTRAIGTRLSETVHDRVLVEGGTWADRAFVVNDWYITAYEPIRDPTGQIIGALYVGLLEAPFVYRERAIYGTFLIMVCVTTLMSLGLLFFVTKWVLSPISRITDMSRRVIGGDLSARVGIRPPGEIGILCRAVDGMADAVAQREEQLKHVTRQQIGQSEKMASIGRLAAGIAHEINNPLTGVLTFTHLLRSKENMDDQDREDLGLIIHETTRVAEIVRGLLDFARESPSDQRLIDLNDVVRRTIRLVRTQKPAKDITISEELQPKLPAIDGDLNQLQQVLLNLSLNACEAMRDGGTLTISTTSNEELVRLKVADTGCGIKREHLEQIFDPFFTTKPVGKGTGLGLSVTYGIVQQHGGQLEVESDIGQGTTFTIILPAARRKAPADADGAETS